MWRNYKKLIFCQFNFHRNFAESGINSIFLEGMLPVKLSFNSYEGVSSILSKNSMGNPLIIMHGLFGSKNNWNSLSKALHNKTKKKVITVDARNHGDSPHSKEFTYHHMAADILLLMKELGIGKANLLGHSMGGRAVMVFALSYPQFVESVTVVDISPAHSSSSMLNMNTYFEALKSVKLARNLSMSQARKSADEQLASWIPDLSIRQFLLTNLTQAEGGGFKWKFNLNDIYNQFEKLIEFPDISNSYHKPALFIGGMKSDYIRPNDHETIKKYFPKADFKYLDAGHWLHSEKPAEFISIVTDFLNMK